MTMDNQNQVTQEWQEQLAALLPPHVWMALRADPKDAVLIFRERPVSYHALTLSVFFPVERGGEYEHCKLVYIPGVECSVYSGGRYGFLSQDESNQEGLWATNTEAILEFHADMKRQHERDAEFRYNDSKATALLFVRTASTPDELKGASNHLDALDFSDRLQACKEWHAKAKQLRMSE